MQRRLQALLEEAGLEQAQCGRPRRYAAYAGRMAGWDEATPPLFLIFTMRLLIASAR
jgi:hypothetical protein